MDQGVVSGTNEFFVVNSLNSRALFLDRDGVINLDTGYVSKVEEIEFIEGIFDLVRTALSLGYRVIVVTNQSGIGRGYFTEKDFSELMEWMREKFLAERCSLDRIYFCPFHPDDGVGEYRRDSAMRKPQPGMVLQAISDFSLDPGKCVLVGDRLSDIEAGRSAGVRHLFLLSAPTSVAGVTDFYVVQNLQAVSDFIQELER